MEEIKKQVGRPKGSIQPKKPANSELTKKLNRAEAESKALQDYVTGAIVCIPRDNETKDFYNEQNGVKITITNNVAVVMSASSTRIFPNSAMVYPWLYTYVDLMLDKETEYDSDQKESIIENVQRFLYLLFDTDANLANPASMVLDWTYWLAKNTSLLENKGKEVKLNEVTVDVLKGMISELIIAKNGITIYSDKATEILNEVKKDVSAFIEKISVYLDDNDCKFNDAIVIEASETTEAEALGEMMFNEQLKEQVMQDI